MAIDEYPDIHTHSTQFRAKAIFSVTTWEEELQIPENTPFSIGIHPKFPVSRSRKAEILDFASRSNCLAIGECGIDPYSKLSLDVQQELFFEQFKWSEELKKPMILHVVRRYDVVLQWLKSLKPTQRWILHAYNGNWETTQQLMRYPVVFSFGNRLLTSEKNQDILRRLPDFRFCLETDDEFFEFEKLYTFVSKIRSVDLHTLIRGVFTLV